MLRKIKQVSSAQTLLEGGGFRVRRPLLVAGGVPLNEPVARRDPFVMNTNDEIDQAIVDYQAGRMGAIDNAAD